MITILGEQELTNSLQSLAKVDTTPILRYIGVAVEDKAKQNCPIGYTHWLSGSITSRVRSEGEYNRVEVYTNCPYAPYVEIGTGIKAGTGQASLYPELSQYKGTGRQTPWGWYDELGRYTKDGQPGIVYTWGQKPQPFLLPALESQKLDIIDYFKRELDKLI